MRAARIGIALAVVFLALPVAANAPISPPSEKQYEDFVQDDQRIIDRFTRLAWARTPSAPINFAGAQTLCSGGSPTIRLPTLKELLTLVDEEPNPAYSAAVGKEIVKHIDLLAFGGDVRSPVDVPYWTSSVEGTNQAFTVDFATGITSTALVGDSRRARCVQSLP